MMGRPPCCDKNGVKKGPWTPEEDIVLVSYIQENGASNWRSVPSNTGLLRCSKSCRLRWTNYLRPGIKRGNFSEEEQKLIVHLQALLGNRWAAIASYLPERTDNDIKNYWNTHLSKRIKRAAAAAGGGGGGGGAIEKGQWERRLQTDINTAKQALRDALSFNPPPASAVYASSAENISRLLKDWVRSSPNSCNLESTHPPATAESSSSTEQTTVLCSTPEASECSLTLAGKEKEEEEEEDLRCENETPLSMLEKWLFDDQMSVSLDEVDYELF